MTRVAIVTGGTRGIGEAVGLAQRDMGVTVAANYLSDNDRAHALIDRTGIDVERYIQSQPMILK